MLFAAAARSSRPRSRAASFRSCVLWGETRKQNLRVATIDRAVLVGRQGLIGVQLGGERRSDIRGSEGVGGEEQNSGMARESRKTRQGRRTRGQCRVEIDGRETLEYVGLTRCDGPEDVRNLSEAVPGIRNETTCM